MITYKTGNILNEDAEALVNTVNCVGIMGRGIALQFKKAHPEMFQEYANACKQELIQPGNMWVYKTGELTNPKYIINFPTKRHWRGKSRMEDIESGLEALVSTIQELGITSIAIPPLGSGLGELHWPDVKHRISEAVGSQNIDIIVFEPSEVTDDRSNRSRDVPKMTKGRASLIQLIDRYVRGLLDPYATLLEVHKLMYFMQVAGEPLRLKYTKGDYGPYAENLRHVLNAIEGHYISGYGDGGDNPNKKLELVPGALEEANAFLDKALSTRSHLDRVSLLVEGFESPIGLELLATVHWLCVQMSLSTIDELLAAVYQWGEHKQQFTPRQILTALQVLTAKGWVSALDESPIQST